jgi:hypothetical protein
MPERPPDTSGLTTISTLDAVPGLRLADRDWRALAAMRHPVKVALWLALLRSSEELMSRESLVELVTTNSERQNPESVNEPASAHSSTQNPEVGAGQTTQESSPVREPTSIPVIIAWAEAAVLKGMRGDMQAWALVADRIEGKIGLRRDDVDPEDERRRGDITTTIESVVRALVDNRLTHPGDDSLDITPATNTLDNERQDNDTARMRRREIAEAARRETQDNQQRGESLAQTNEEPEERDLTIPDGDPRRRNGQAHD